MKRLNCPLCVNTFGYSFGLECHLLSVHQDDLQMIRDGKLSQQPCGCLCCAAQFLKIDTFLHPEIICTNLVFGAHCFE